MPCARFDVLGNPVVIGERYCYLHRKNGFLRVVVGRVLGFSEQFVRLTVQHRGRALYGEMIANERFTAKEISVYASSLVRLAEDSTVCWAPTEIPLLNN